MQKNGILVMGGVHYEIGG